MKEYGRFSDLEWRNGKITKAVLGIGEYDSLTLGVTFDVQFGGSCHYGIDSLGGQLDTAETTGSVIYYLLKVVGVNNWSQLEGSYIQAGFDEHEYCKAIRNIMDDGLVFCIQDFKEIEDERKQKKVIE